MQKQKEILLTAEGYRLFEEELNRLTTVTRQEVRARVRDTKPTSDEGDDAAYDSAKVEQALVEGRIQELREILTRARILSEDEIRTDEVQLGSRVLVTNLTTGRQVNLKLVSPWRPRRNAARSHQIAGGRGAGGPAAWRGCGCPHPGGRRSVPHRTDHRLSLFSEIDHCDGTAAAVG